MSYKTIEGLTRQLTQEAHSTAFATDDEFDCKKTVDSEVMVWWRDWYEDGVIEPWDGPHQRADEVIVCENREK